MSEVCGGCRFWCGRCLNGVHNRLASALACERFMKREVQ